MALSNYPIPLDETERIVIADVQSLRESCLQNAPRLHRKAIGARLGVHDFYAQITARVTATELVQDFETGVGAVRPEVMQPAKAADYLGLKAAMLQRGR